MIIDFINNKKKYFLGFAIVLIIILVVVEAVIMTNSKKSSQKEVEEVYTIYIDFNSLIKLTFKEEYTQCKKNGQEFEACSDITTEVLSHKLINNDAKENYNDMFFEEQSLEDALVSLIKTALDNKVKIDTLTITTDSKHLDKEKITEILSTKLSRKIDFTVNVDYQEYIDEEAIKTQDVVEEEILYLVTFDANGGSKVENQILKENGLVTEPTEPTREGYTFNGWQLSGEDYNFNTPVVSDITLVARWTKIPTTTTTTPKPSTGTSKPSNPGITTPSTPVTTEPEPTEPSNPSESTEPEVNPPEPSNPSEEQNPPTTDPEENTPNPDTPDGDKETDNDGDDGNQGNDNQSSEDNDDNEGNNSNTQDLD